MNIRTALSRGLIAGAAVVAIALPQAASAHDDFSFNIGLGVPVAPVVAPAVVARPVYPAPRYGYAPYGAYVPPVVTYRYSPWPYYYQYPRYYRHREFHRGWHHRDWDDD